MIKLNRQPTTLATRDGMATYFEAWSCANKRAGLALQAGDRELMLRERESSDCLYSLYENCKEPAHPANLPDGVKFWGKQDGAPDRSSLYLDRGKHIENAMNSKPVSMPDYLGELICDDDAIWRDKVADWLEVNDDRNWGYNYHRLTIGNGETSLSGEIEIDYFISEDNSGKDQYWAPCYVVIDGDLYDLRDSSIADCDILSDTLGWCITDIEGKELPSELNADRAQMGYGSNPNNELSKLLLGHSEPVWHYGLDCFLGRIKDYPYPVKIFVDHPFYS